MELFAILNRKNIFEHFKIPFLPPEVRRDGTEIERVTKDTKFLELSDIRGTCTCIQLGLTGRTRFLR